MRLRSPISVDINLTRRCNLSCAFCSANPVGVGDTVAREQELRVDELRLLFAEIQSMGVFFIRLAGGEPLIRHDIWQILDDLSRFSFHKVVLTNGVPLSRRMTSELRNAGVGTIGISLDGPSPEIHDLHRGVSGTFKRVMTNLENVRNAGIAYSAQFAVTRYNVSQLIQMVQLCEEEGFFGLKFILLNLSGNARDAKHYFPSWAQWSKSIVELTDYLRERSPRIQVSILPPHEDPVPYELFFPLRDSGRIEDLFRVWGIDRETAPPAVTIGCAAGRTQLTVFEDGSVYGCDLMKDHDFWRAGNIREKPLQTIWDNSPVFQQLRDLHKRDLEGVCGSCSYNGCGGGCRASAFNLHHHIKASDSNCLMLR